MTAMNTTTKTDDLHIVVAALESEGRFVGYTAVSAPTTYDDALKIWDQRERNRSSHAKRHNHHVAHYAVRSIADPRFAPLVGKGYADGVHRSGTRYYPDSGRVKAAKAWAKLSGYSGFKGGWIYDPSHRPVIQGWESFAHLCKQAGRIAQGADGLWYVIDREMVQ